MYLVHSLIILIFLILQQPHINSGRLAWVNGFLGGEQKVHLWVSLMHINGGMDLWGRNSLLLAGTEMLSDGATDGAGLVLENKENSLW